MMELLSPVLKNWIFDGDILHGKIYGDSRFKDGTIIDTNTVSIIQPTAEGLSAWTLSGTRYLLDV